MPYLKDKEDRNYLDLILEAAKNCLIKPGRLNYFIFKLAKISCHNYEQFRNFVGEIEMVKQEIYRRYVAPYEDIKIEENGDVE